MKPKEKLLNAVLSQLRKEYESLAKALADSSAAATDPGSKAESKYDTRSLEMSYLAAGQARQAEDLAKGVKLLENFEQREFIVTDRVDVGALVEVEREGQWESYFLLPAGGGIVVEHEGVQVTTLTPESPLFSELLGKRMGEPLAGSASLSDLC